MNTAKVHTISAIQTIKLPCCSFEGAALTSHNISDQGSNYNSKIIILHIYYVTELLAIRV